MPRRNFPAKFPSSTPTASATLSPFLATTSFAPPLSPTQPTARRARRLVAAEDEGGWESRPLVPELQQVPGRTSPDTPKEERVPWDWKRFVKQSSEFIELPSLLPKPKSPPRAVAPGESFGALELFPLDDVVMGGASSSSFDNAARTWRGEVTTRNSGGFVGVRSKTLAPALDLTGASGVAIRVRPRGAPLRLKFILRDSTDFNGSAGRRRSTSASRRRCRRGCSTAAPRR